MFQISDTLVHPVDNNSYRPFKTCYENTWGFPTYMLLDVIWGDRVTLIPNNCITIQTIVTSYYSLDDYNEDIARIESKIPRSLVLEKLRYYARRNMITDTSLILSNNDKLCVHRCITAVRCSQLGNLYGTNLCSDELDENGNRTVNLSLLPKSSVEPYLCFLYNMRLPANTDYQELLIFVNPYNVKLATFCETEIIKRAKLNTILDIVYFCIKNQCSQLERVAVGVILASGYDLRTKGDWKKLAEEYPQFVAYVFQVYADEQIRKLDQEGIYL